MSDRKQDSGNGGNGGNGEFDRDLAATSRAYKNAGADTPSAAIDDAIRAAARRAVRSQPQALAKSWVSRWSAPLSAAALVVLTVSVGFLAINEQPGLAPEPLNKAIEAKPPAAPEANAEISTPPENAAPGATLAPRRSLPVPAVEKKSQLDRQRAASPDPLPETAQPDPERRRNELGGATSATVVAKDAHDALALNSPSAVAAAPPPAGAPNTLAKSLAKQAPAFVADPPIAETAARQANTGVASGTVKSESAQAKQPVAEASRADGRSDAASTRQKSQLPASPVATVLAPEVASPAAISPPQPVAVPSPQVLADKVNEPPEAWIKRILELKQQGKIREFDDELARFRKRYPNFRLPEALRESRGGQ